MKQEDFIKETLDSWHKERNHVRPEGVGPESISSFLARGLVGCAILLIRQLKAGYPLSPGWRDEMGKFVLELMDELQKQD